MNHEILSSLEIDAIGEIVNISLGSSATAVSNMLDSRVDITVPRVRVESYDEFEFKNLEPAIAVTIDYVTGISGNNIMILKRNDIRVILEMLMQTEIDEEGFELDDISLSAVCEVMNQMMGASSTALSELMGRMINISPPATFEVKDAKEFKEKHFEQSENFVVIEFDLTIEGKLQSEFINVMPMPLAKDLVATFLADMNMDMDAAEQVSEQAHASEAAPTAPTPAEENSDGVMSQEQKEAILRGSAVEEAPAPAEESSGGVMSQEQIEAMLRGSAVEEAPVVQAPSAPAAPAPVAPTPTVSVPAVSAAPKVIEVKESKNSTTELTGVAKQENVDMLMDVPLVVSVEIGRTKKPIREILEITQGSLIVLDKLAGDQVELYANNRCIARGDVVVVHDNFGIRVTEVLGKK